MNTRIACCFVFLCLMLQLHARAQTFYHFHYSFPAPADSTRFDALFILQNNGTGIARVRSTTNGSPALMHATIEEVNFATAGDTLPRYMHYTFGNRKAIAGAMPAGIDGQQIIFLRDSVTGFYQPYGVSSSANNNSVKAFDSMRLLSRSDLDVNFVLTYFRRDEALYQGLFANNTRSLSQADRKAKLYLLAIGNSNDTIIGQSVLKDLDRAVETFSGIASFMGIGLVKTTLSGKDVSKPNLMKALAELKPGANDIVVFYYAGHGFRKPKDNRDFPHIDLRSKPDNSYMVNSMNMEDIYYIIKAKKARLNLVISDCCNTEVTETNTIGVPPPLTRAMPLGFSMVNCMQLFFNTKPQSYLVNAAGVGQRASSNNKFGGFFSYYFKAALESQLGVMNNGTNWERVLNDATRQTERKARRTYCAKPYIPANICEQTPIKIPI